MFSIFAGQLPFMYATLLVLHSLFRWLVVISLGTAIVAAYRGYRKGLPFSSVNNQLRHWTATIAHLQLTIGMILYFQSPLVKYFWKTKAELPSAFDFSFYGVVHALLMFAAVVILTIGSAKAKRQASPKDQFRTMLIWYTLALLIILVAIPWPFSPLAQRPLFRSI